MSRSIFNLWFKRVNFYKDFINMLKVKSKMRFSKAKVTKVMREIQLHELAWNEAYFQDLLEREEYEKIITKSRQFIKRIKLKQEKRDREERDSKNGNFKITKLEYYARNMKAIAYERLILNENNEDKPTDYGENIDQETYVNKLGKELEKLKELLIKLGNIINGIIDRRKFFYGSRYYDAWREGWFMQVYIDWIYKYLNLLVKLAEQETRTDIKKRLYKKVTNQMKQIKDDIITFNKKQDALQSSILKKTSSREIDKYEYLQISNVLNETVEKNTPLLNKCTLTLATLHFERAVSRTEAYVDYIFSSNFRLISDDLKRAISIVKENIIDYSQSNEAMKIVLKSLLILNEWHAITLEYKKIPSNIVTDGNNNLAIYIAIAYYRQRKLKQSCEIFTEYFSDKELENIDHKKIDMAQDSKNKKNYKRVCQHFVEASSALHVLYKLSVAYGAKLNAIKNVKGKSKSNVKKTRPIKPVSPSRPIPSISIATDLAPNHNVVSKSQPIDSKYYLTYPNIRAKLQQLDMYDTPHFDSMNIYEIDEYRTKDIDRAFDPDRLINDIYKMQKPTVENWKKQMIRGMMLYEAGNFHASLEEFRKANSMYLSCIGRLWRTKMMARSQLHIGLSEDYYELLPAVGFYQIVRGITDKNDNAIQIRREKEEATEMLDALAKLSKIESKQKMYVSEINVKAFAIDRIIRNLGQKPSQILIDEMKNILSFYNEYFISKIVTNCFHYQNRGLIHMRFAIVTTSYEEKKQALLNALSDYIMGSKYLTDSEFSNMK